tara:strand:- start:541 stop:672 length:132 start_codon:yes stop_codon:yes gene_type:complete
VPAAPRAVLVLARLALVLARLAHLLALELALWPQWAASRWPPG